MLKKINRINKTRDMNKVYRLGRSAHTAALVIKFNISEKGSQKAATRIAFVVSKKVSKRAVERNRVKRVLRNEMRLKLPILPTGDYMIIAKPSATNFKNPSLREELEKGLGKLNRPTPARTPRTLIRPHGK